MAVERLEERRLLAVAVVDTHLDIVDFNDGVTSLREAIFAANTLPGPDTILFDGDLTAEAAATIQLTLGELIITESLTIDGPDSSLLTIDAQQLSRVFNVTATSGDFTFRALTLTNGRAESAVFTADETKYAGGAIRSLTKGLLRIEDCAIRDNSAIGRAVQGGAIYAAGATQLSGTIVSGNRLIGSAISGTGASGGGVYVKGDVTLVDSVVRDNSIEFANPGFLNTAIGGGIYTLQSITLVRSAIVGNVANGTVGYAGGMSAVGDVSLDRSRISGNEVVGSGGGVVTLGALTMSDSSVDDNRATITGGGILGDTEPILIVNSTVSSNQAKRAGGMFAEGNVTIRHSTIVDNTAVEESGGIDMYVAGVDEPTIHLIHTIVANNTAPSAPNINSDGSILNVQYSLIGYNGFTQLAEAPLGSPDANGNFIGGPMHGAIDPLLSPLDSFGDTRPGSHSPQLGSPVIDAGDPTVNGGVGDTPSFDQSGMPYIRVVDGDGDGAKRIDIGAVEYRTILHLQLLPSDYNHDNVVDALDYTLWRNTFGTEVDAFAGADGNGNGVVDDADYGIWKSRYGDRSLLPLPVPFPIPFPAPTPPPPPPNEFSILVTTLSDATDLGDGLMTLREAVFVANTLNGADTIEFAPALTAGGPATILLTEGELAITDSLTIHGPGAYLLTIDASGNDPTPDSAWNDGIATNDGDGSRVFNIDDGVAALQNVETIGLRITGGDVLDPGGGILARENLVIRRSIVTGNLSASQSVLGGGGIFSAPDFYSGPLAPNSLSVFDCIISNNAAFNGEGGGIRKPYGSLTVERSVIEENVGGKAGGGISAADQGIVVQINESLIRRNLIRNNNQADGGGGIFLFDAIATISNTSIVENEAVQGGGVLAWRFNLPQSTATTTIVNSTISGNIARGSIGGIYSRSNATVNVSHSTIANNLSGAFNFPVSIDSTIVAGNSASDTFAIVGDNLYSPTSSNIVGPLFGSGSPLFLDGRRMPVQVLMPNSPAIDAGSAADVPGVGGVPEFDQRGAPWSRVAGGRIDIGAVEQQANPLPGDYSNDGIVDAVDYTVWRNTVGSTNDFRADGSGPTDGVPDGVVDALDYAFWKANYGNTLPPPGSGGLSTTFFAAEVEDPVVETVAIATGVAAVEGEKAAPGFVMDVAERAPASRSLRSVASRRLSADEGDAGLLARWLASRARDADRDRESERPWSERRGTEDADCLAALDDAFELLALSGGRGSS